MRTAFRSLFWRIALLFFVVFILVGILYVYLFLFTAEMYVQETDQRMNRQLAPRVASRFQDLIEPEIRRGEINALFRDLQVLHPGVEPYLIDTTGAIITTPLGHTPPTFMVDLLPVRSFLAGDGSTMHLGDDPCGLTESKVFTAASVLRSDGTPLGYLYIVLHGQEYESLTSRLFDSYILTLGSRSLAITLLGAIAISLIILAFLLSRLRRLTASVRAFGAGDYSTRAGVRSSDEIGELANTFNTMASTIERSIEDLKMSDVRRREFFANISHDLKTPLTSIRGFVETLLLKRDDLPAGQREQYLQTILTRTERLTTMVSQILELSRLEARETALVFEQIDLKDTLSDLFLELSPIAEKAGVTLTSRVPDDLPPLSGDLKLVERALRNLLDNAVRHTPEGGEVSVVVEGQKGTTVISVKDTGEGIDAAHLSHVFDRFYRGDKSRVGQSARTGLGLPITKQIVEMHNGSIQVSSSPEAGTTFTLAFPSITRPHDRIS